MPSHQRGEYPQGLKPGDFIQTSAHFGDIYFEVLKCFQSDDGFWMVVYVSYDKYGRHPETKWVNSASSIRRVIPAEMAVPVMQHKRLRFHSTQGQYDPFFGFAPAGVALRTRDEPVTA